MILAKSICLLAVILINCSKLNAQCFSESITQVQQLVNSIVGSNYCKDYQAILPIAKKTLIIFTETYVNCQRGDNLFVYNELGATVYNYCASNYGASMSFGFAEGRSFKIRFFVPFGGQIYTYFNLFYYDISTTALPTTGFPITTTGFPITTTGFPITSTVAPVSTTGLLSTLFPTLSTATTKTNAPTTFTTAFSTIASTVTSTGIPVTTTAFTSTSTAVPTFTVQTTTLASALRCGVPQVAPIDGNLRIIGGFEVNKNSFPWQVYITNNRIMCGATLVSNLWLVTAAHCVYGESGQFYATLGAHNLGISETGKITIPVSKIIYHEGYSDSSLVNDIAVMKLSTPVTFSTQIQPLCLYTKTPVGGIGLKGTVTGWGITDLGRSSNVLEQVSVTIRQNSECYFSLTSNQICAGDGSQFVNGGAKTYDSCQGDSGGPLTIKENNVYYLAGVVSYGGSSCDGVGVYTNVANYLGWLYSKMV